MYIPRTHRVGDCEYLLMDAAALLIRRVCNFYWK